MFFTNLVLEFGFNWNGFLGGVGLSDGWVVFPWIVLFHCYHIIICFISGKQESSTNFTRRSNSSSWLISKFRMWSNSTTRKCSMSPIKSITINSLRPSSNALTSSLRPKHHLNSSKERSRNWMSIWRLLMENTQLSMLLLILAYLNVGFGRRCWRAVRVWSLTS